MSEIIVHPNFDSNVALLKLDEPLRFCYHFQTICISLIGVPENETGLVISWVDSHRTGTPAQRHLQIAQTQIFSMEHCNQISSSEFEETSAHDKSGEICSVFGNDTSSLCHSRGGGLLTKKVDKWYELVGVTSWTRKCEMYETPWVYSDVFHYLPWLMESCGTPDYGAAKETKCFAALIVATENSALYSFSKSTRLTASIFILSKCISLFIF